MTVISFPESCNSSRKRKLSISENFIVFCDLNFSNCDGDYLKYKCLDQCTDMFLSEEEGSKKIKYLLILWLYIK